MTSASVVQYVTGENKAPFEIMPIPGKVVDSSEALVDGKYQCSLCRKSFAEEQQFTLHKNIHYFERPFRCEGKNDVQLLIKPVQGSACMFSQSLFLCLDVSFSVHQHNALEDRNS